MKKINLVFFALALVMLTGQAEAKKVLLQYNLKPGTHFTITHENNQDVAQEMMGQSQNTVMNSKMTYDFTVQEVAGSGILFSCQLIYARMEMKSMMGDMIFDSNDPDEQADAFRSLIPMLNSPFSFSLSASGEVTGVSFSDELKTKIGETIGMVDEIPMAGSLTAGFTSEEAMVGTLGGLFISFPQEKVTVGKAWEVESEINQMIAFKTFTENTLVKAGKEENELQQVSRFEQGDAPPMEMEGMTLQYDLSGGKEGHFILSANTGLIKSGEFNSAISGVISIDSPQLPAPMTIPMTIKGTEKLALQLLSE